MSTIIRSRLLKPQTNSAATSSNLRALANAFKLLGIKLPTPTKVKVTK
jgi:hypothetical protein